MKVLIGIQARSGSKRLPRKAFELISGKTMLGRVIETCEHAAGLIDKKGSRCQVAVLTPEGDPIVNEFKRTVEVIQGPEQDVLARYARAAELHQPDLIVRITGDCPLIPGAFIAHMVSLADQRGYDYISNSDERFRTSIDGNDCEVFTLRMLQEADRMARAPYDREHVTPWMRKTPPDWARLGLAMNHFDLSPIKLSVDTIEDLERVRDAFESAFMKFQEAAKVYGRGCIHRI